MLDQCYIKLLNLRNDVNIDEEIVILLAYAEHIVLLVENEVLNNN
jgi:hypothetical protein